MGISTFANDALSKGVEFSVSASNKMNMPDRFVPVQLMIDIIRLGASMPDPHDSRALMYYGEIVKSGTIYKFEVLYDITTNTIWHFQYYR